MNENRTPGLVSVVIPTYNNAKFVPEAVTSVLNQSYPHVEIIVIDDGSSDDTKSAVAPFSDKIQFIKQANQGASVARNTGIKSSRGEWVAFLDSDDLWDSEKLALQLSELKASEGALVHTCNISLERDSLTTDNFFRSIGYLRGDSDSWTLDRPIVDLLQYRFPWLQSTVIHHSVFDVVGLLDPKYRLYHDYDLMLRIAISGAKWVVSELVLSMILRRDAAQNLSALSVDKKQSMLLDWLDIHRSALPNLEHLTEIERSTFELSLRNSYAGALKHAIKLNDSEMARNLAKQAARDRIPGVKRRHLAWTLLNTLGMLN